MRWIAPAVPAAAIVAAAAGVATAPNDAPARPAEPPAEPPRAVAAGASRTATARRAERHSARAHARSAARWAGIRRGRVAIRAAASRVGAPYALGATGPAAFDCSGLTRWAMRRARIHLPRTSFAQAGAGFGIPRSKIRTGDLVFFSTAGAGASHVGIATSRRTVISATSHGVMRHSISDSYWGSHYVGARRVATRR
jgi:cell wall-associated NlpC family hydrolase